MLRIDNLTLVLSVIILSKITLSLLLFCRHRGVVILRQTVLVNGWQNHYFVEPFIDLNGVEKSEFSICRLYFATVTFFGG